MHLCFDALIQYRVIYRKISQLRKLYYIEIAPTSTLGLWRAQQLRGAARLNIFIPSAAHDF